jgi:hypothetical protein
MAASASTTSTTASQPALQERLPDAAPLLVFFIPNFMGAFLAFLLERCHVETKLSQLVSNHHGTPTQQHRYGLLGLGIFALGLVNSYLSGTVVNARVRCGVKLPALYANKSEHDKYATEFNCIQRGHQNFLEQYGMLVLSVVTTTLLADRPNIAGCILLLVSVSRVWYAMNYRLDIVSRIGPFLTLFMATNIGMGYAFWMAGSIVFQGFNVLNDAAVGSGTE